MPVWAQIVLVLCAVAVTLALVPVLLAFRRAAERTDRVLALAEQELRPLLGELQELTHDLRTLSRQASGELDRVGAVLQRAHDVSDGVGRVLIAVAGLTRMGQMVKVAAGVRTGLEVFVHRWRKQRGGHHD
jgi:hypothetical protein